MKKIMVFALMALLMGGFAYNANAQVRKTAPADKKTAPADKKDTPKEENWDKVVKEFEVAVDQCVTLYEKMQKGDGSKNDTKEFDKSLVKAENLKTKLEGAKDQLDRTQMDRFKKAKDKLMKVYKKG